jgi:hypothetical protein
LKKRKFKAFIMDCRIQEVLEVIEKEKNCQLKVASDEINKLTDKCNEYEMQQINRDAIIEELKKIQNENRTYLDVTHIKCKKMVDKCKEYEMQQINRDAIIDEYNKIIESIGNENRTYLDVIHIMRAMEHSRR